MKYLLIILILLLPAYASAQNFPRSEFFGGYSFLRTDSETGNFAIFGAPGSTTRRERANLNGFNIGITGNINSRVGVVADINGAYGSMTYRFNSPLVSSTFNARTRLHSFLFGPQVYLGNSNKFFLRGMAGVSRLDQSGNLFDQRTSQTETAFTSGFGGGLDLRMSDRVSVRAFQVDYILTKFDRGGISNNTQGAIRLSVGFTFRNRE